MFISNLEKKSFTFETIQFNQKKKKKKKVYLVSKAIKALTHASS